MAPPEVGLVGVGPWGAYILRDLRALGVTVHVMARSRASIDRARAGGAATITDRLQNLPASCSGFVIANRTVEHLDAVDGLLARDLPIFVEKPLGVDLDRIRRLPDKAHDLVFVMHKWRYHPGILELARIAADRQFGPVEGLRSFRLGWGNLHPDVSSLWILAPHDLSIALAILGETPKVVGAFADPMWGRGDGAIAHLRTRSGVPVTFEVSSGHPSAVRRIVLRCKDAICQLDSSNYEAITVRKTDDASESLIAVDDTMPLLAELKAFVEHLAGGPAPATRLEEEIEIIATIREIEQLISNEIHRPHSDRL